LSERVACKFFSQRTEVSFYTAMSMLPMAAKKGMKTHKRPFTFCIMKYFHTNHIIEDRTKED